MIRQVQCQKLVTKYKTWHNCNRRNVATQVRLWLSGRNGILITQNAEALYRNWLRGSFRELAITQRLRWMKVALDMNTNTDYNNKVGSKKKGLKLLP